MTIKAAKPRRSQADRSAATRAKVIAAARDILCVQGYSGATMHAIRDATGMSLGAIQHQFPTKARIMAAVAAEFSDYRTTIYSEAIRRGTTPRQSLENLLDANFAMLGRPEMAALLEIHLARRNSMEAKAGLGNGINRRNASRRGPESAVRITNSRTRAPQVTRRASVTPGTASSCPSRPLNWPKSLTRSA